VGELVILAIILLGGVLGGFSQGVNFERRSWCKAHYELKSDYDQCTSEGVEFYKKGEK